MEQFHETLMGFLPTVEAMIKKEKDHLEFLKENKTLPEVQSMIDVSERILLHLKFRLQEYSLYIADHTNPPPTKSHD